VDLHSRNTFYEVNPNDPGALAVAALLGMGTL
jgi:hypothetical protein